MTRQMPPHWWAEPPTTVHDSALLDVRAVRLRSMVVSLTASDIAIGLLVAMVVGLSKTALPGAGLLATPLMAEVFSGRQVPGSTLLILLCADVFAVRWYRDSTRWDLLKPLIPWVTAGFAVGAAFFIIVGSADRSLEIVIGVTILLMVTLQAVRMVRKSSPVAPTLAAAAFFGTAGGFTTFVANQAGPVLNSYLLRLGLSKEELVGTSAWFYFAVNVAKIPVFAGLGWWSSGGNFFTRDGFALAAFALPGVFAGVFLGRHLFARVPQKLFMTMVLVLAAFAAVRLLVNA